MNLQQPSSTITAATLAAAGTSFFWYALIAFYLTPHAITLAPETLAGLMGSSTTLIAGVVGYFKRENVLPITRPNPEQGS